MSVRLLFLLLFVSDHRDFELYALSSAQRPKQVATPRLFFSASRLNIRVYFTKVFFTHF